MHVKLTAAALSSLHNSPIAPTPHPTIPLDNRLPESNPCGVTRQNAPAASAPIPGLNFAAEHAQEFPQQSNHADSPNLSPTSVLRPTDKQPQRSKQDNHLQLPLFDLPNNNPSAAESRRRKLYTLARRAHSHTPLLPDRDRAPAGEIHIQADPLDIDECRISPAPYTFNMTSATTTETTNPGVNSDNPRPSMSDVMNARYAKTFGTVNPHVTQTICWIGVACLAAVGVYLHHGMKGAIEFVTAYIVEYSLSIDNLFVFMVIFQYFRVSDAAQETALNWGVVGAMVLRGAMILLGKALVDKFHFVTVFFACILLYSSGKLLFTDDDDDEDLENNGIVKFAKRLFPCTDKYYGDRFFVVDADGRALATPLLVVLITVELSDVVFALDSVPAVLGLSNSTLVIYSSNILAVMGLRSLFFVVSDAIKDLRFLQQALALVLGFIGIKMIMAALLSIEIPVLLSLGLVVGTLFVGVLLSVLFPSPENDSDGDGEADPDDQPVEDEGAPEQASTDALLV